MPIFQDSNGLAVKFFIQKDLPKEVQAELCETITSLGGRVEAKVPRQGYILVQPGTAEEERLRLCWTSSDRPDRFFVPYTYVEACKIAGMLLKQIFLENGVPVTMHIHPSIANVNARSHLAARIMHSGGDPYASLQSARVILADPQSDIFQHLVKTYQDMPDKYIESYLWVKKCIEKGVVAYTPMVYKNPGGRRPGEERMQFTEEDEEKLCEWIAAKIPYKEIGGRTGNRLYQQLCDLAGEPEYAWVSRHTWQSWRERYKKNAERLDKVIARIVEQKMPQRGGKGQYGYVRQAEEKPKKHRKKKTKAADEPFEECSSEIVNMLEMPAAGPSHLRPAMDPPMGAAPLHPSLRQLTAMGNPYTGVTPPPPPSRVPVPPGSPNARASSTEEELEDEGTEWAVRVGNAPPPMWAKRRAPDEDDQDQEVYNKRPRIENETPPPAVAPVVQNVSPLLPATLLTIAKLHVIDRSIREIAKDFRFTVEEVQEYYDKCADMVKTRLRFQKMREELNTKFNDL